MFARFTATARRAVALGQDEARALGHGRIGTEHLLLGLSAQLRTLAGWTAGWRLESLGRDHDDLRETIVRIAGRGERPTVGRIPFTLAATCAVELANVEVDRRRANFVGTEHLLLGILDQLESDTDGDVALRALTELGLTTGDLRETIEPFIPAPSGGLSWMLRRTAKLEFRGVRGAGWVDLLSRQPDLRVKRLLVRAAGVAVDDGRTVIETRDLLAALSALPDGARLLQDAAVTGPGPAAERAAAAGQPDWTQVDAGDQVVAAIVAAQRRAIDRDADTVSVDDLLLALATEQGALLRRDGWDLDGLPALLMDAPSRG